MKLSVIALDYDGTIATSDVVAHAMRAAIAAARTERITAVLVTGRTSPRASGLRPASAGTTPSRASLGPGVGAAVRLGSPQVCSAHSVLRTLARLLPEFPQPNGGQRADSARPCSKIETGALAAKLPSPPVIEDDNGYR